MNTKTHLTPEEVRSESIKFRATPAQKRRIEQLAKRCAMTVSDYVLSRSFNYEPKPRTTALEEQLCTELSSVRTDYKKYFSALRGMTDDNRRQMFNNEHWMAGALRLLDAQRVRIDYILNVAFAKNHLPPRTSKTLKTDAPA
jgi:hypothetical protein